VPIADTATEGEKAGKGAGPVAAPQQDCRCRHLVAFRVSNRHLPVSRALAEQDSIGDPTSGGGLFHNVACLR